jgi:di/tricarboxylate transporter
MLAVQIMPNVIVVVLMAPVSLAAAAGLGISPQAAMMVVAVAASSSFLSPLGHPANVLIMGPGGYRVRDYARAGLPLTLIVLLVTLLVLPLVWRL